MIIIQNIDSKHKFQPSNDGALYGIVMQFYDCYPLKSSLIIPAMAKKITPDKPVEIPKPLVIPEWDSPVDPDEPVIPLEDPEIIPDEDPFENPPYEIPEPGEGP